MDNLINMHCICCDQCYLFSVCFISAERSFGLTFAVNYSFKIKSLMYYVVDTLEKALTRFLLISVLHVKYSVIIYIWKT